MEPIYPSGAYPHNLKQLSLSLSLFLSIFLSKVNVR